MLNTAVRRYKNQRVIERKELMGSVSTLPFLQFCPMKPIAASVGHKKRWSPTAAQRIM